MILVTVGTQLPFDRLVEAVDRIAPELDEEIIAQVGNSKYVCKNIEAKENFRPEIFEEYLQNCSRIISHAGIGTILNAQKKLKPIVLVPRLAKFGEHRNDHQIATCRSLLKRTGVYVCHDPLYLTAAFVRQATEPLAETHHHQALLMLNNSIRKIIDEGSMI